MQKFVSQPSNNGGYEVAKWDEIQQQYIPVPEEVYPMEELAHSRAQQLNEDYREQIKTFNKKRKKMKKMEKQLIDDNSILPKEDVENELISPSKKSKDGDVLSPNEQETDNELLPQTNNTNNDGLIEFDPNTRAKLERMKELYKYGREQDQS